jgi:hypothetical protein
MLGQRAWRHLGLEAPRVAAPTAVSQVDLFGDG